MSAHREFPLDCNLPGGAHQVGDRHVEGGRVVDELTEDGSWASVCPIDDVPLIARVLRPSVCPVCRRTYAELLEVAR